MTPADLMAIMTFSSDVKVMEDFTDDRDLLEKDIKSLIIGEGQGFEISNQDDSAADTGAAFQQDDTEFNIFNTDRQLSALETAVKMLGSLNEKKSLVYFASGIQRNGLDNQAQLRSTINAAIRANVSFYPIDARGLVARGAAGRRDQRIARRPGHVFGKLRAGARPAISRISRRRCTRWPPIRAAKPCSTTTIFPWASCRRRKT